VVPRKYFVKTDDWRCRKRLRAPALSRLSRTAARHDYCTIGLKVLRSDVSCRWAEVGVCSPTSSYSLLPQSAWTPLSGIDLCVFRLQRSNRDSGFDL